MKITGKILLAVMAGVFAMGWSQTVLAQASLATRANMAVLITEAHKAEAARSLAELSLFGKVYG